MVKNLSFTVVIKSGFPASHDNGKSDNNFFLENQGIKYFLSSIRKSQEILLCLK